MRTVTTMPQSIRRRTKSSAYDRFFDGRIWEILPDDFPQTSLATLRGTLIRRAGRKQVRVQTSLRHDPPRLFIRCLNPPEKGPTVS